MLDLNGHYGCSPVQSGHFGGSTVMVFGRTLEARMGKTMKSVKID